MFHREIRRLVSTILPLCGLLASSGLGTTDGQALAAATASWPAADVTDAMAFLAVAPADLAALGTLFSSPDAISGQGQLDVLRYGHVFKARQLAAVRGAGSYYDGKYYVKSVTHNIKRGEYKQSFTLARGGVVSSVSTVSV